MSDRFRFRPGRINLRKKFINLSRDMTARILYFLLGVAIVAGATYIYADVGVFPKNSDSAKTEDSLLTHDEWNDIADFANVFTDVITVDDVNDRVGIGISPVAGNVLTVGGAVRATGGFRTDGGNLLTLRSADDWTFTTGGVADRMVITNTGNVGIGTTEPGAKLHIRDDSADADTEIRLSNDVQGWRLKTMGSDSDKFYLNSGDTNVMAITTGGNVGIGTTNPAFKLHAYSDTAGVGTIVFSEAANATSWSNTGFRVKTPQNTWNIFMDDNANGEIPSGALGFYSYDGNTYPLTMLENGNVGIGTTAPQDKLNIAGSQISVSQDIVSNGIYDWLAIRSNRTTNDYGGLNSPYAKIYLVTPGADTTGEGNNHGIADIRFATKGSSVSSVLTDRLTIRSGGNVGIGTTGPAAKLHILDADARGTTMDVLRLGGVTATHYYTFQHIGAGAVGSDKLTLTALDDDNIMTWVANANVGIGTTAPGQKLTVAGTIESTSGGVKFPDGTTQTTAGGIPSGMLAWFAGACPTGWTLRGTVANHLYIPYIISGGTTVEGSTYAGYNSWSLCLKN